LHGRTPKACVVPENIIPMKRFLRLITTVQPGNRRCHLALLGFRIAAAAELIAAHGLKKIGVGVTEAETVPNPLHLPEAFNQLFATAANLVFPLFVIAGLFTRLATLPILAVTFTGFFVMHLHDPILVRDTPYIYSVVFLFILVMGPGKYSFDYRINKIMSHE